MKTATLILENLHLLSDELTSDFSEQMKTAVADCRNRPSSVKAREVTVKIKITPHPSDPEDVLIEPVTTLRTPARKIDPIRARRSKKDQLQFDFGGE